MTYLKTSSRNPSPSTPHPATADETYFAALAPAFQAVIDPVTAWIAAAIVAHAQRDTKRFKAAILLIALAMTVLKGSRTDKLGFLKKIFAKHNAKLERIYARYLVWRQRKCWMWGGGFAARSYMRLGGIMCAAQDKNSFDALIPDWAAPA